MTTYFVKITKSLTIKRLLNCIFLMLVMERYRSGHNEAVLKTVCPKGREGSNPSLSASSLELSMIQTLVRRSTQAVEGAPLERE